MRHTRITTEVAAEAACFALGAMSSTEAQRFFRHVGSCPACTTATNGFSAVVGEMGLLAAPVDPPADIRTRVLAQVEAEAFLRFHFRVLPEGTWQDIGPGVRRKDLATDAYLVRLEPGSRLVRQALDVVEHWYVIEGDLRIAGRQVHTGDYHRALPGTVDEAPTTTSGCLVLVVESPS